DLADLGKSVPRTRTNAFLAIVAKLQGNLGLNDLSPQHARRIATYLVKITKPEADDIATKLPKLAASRNLMLALADTVDDADAFQQEACETVVGSLLEQPLQFGKSDWPLRCRRLLLLQALDLPGKQKSAEQTAEIMRDLYKEQGI